jgi:glyoxylase-like metal-dependent hydrolase (beta-lactamase superfamily II)
MTEPIISAHEKVAPATDLLGTYAPVLGGYLAVNAFVLHAERPVLIDSGIVGMREPMLRALERVIDPARLEFLYLTHVDADHVGCLDELLVRAPRAKVVTTFLGMAKLALARQIAPERLLLLNPGQELDVGDRKLLVAKPPCFDAPETTMLWDPKERTLFSSDYFGGLVPAPVEAASDVPPAALREGMVTWLTVDSPWIHGVDPHKLARAARLVAELAPKTILSAHLAPARGLTQALTENVLCAPSATPFTGPDQAAFEHMLAGAA